MATPYSTGGVPDNTDVIVGSVFIAIFGISGLVHLRQYQAYGYKFIWSLFCFGFCVVRCLAIGCRIALKDQVTSKVLACITQILLAAGIAFLFVVNLQMSRRFFGQLHPRHSVRVHCIVTGACYLIDPLILIVIIAIIQSYCELTNLRILQIDRTIRTVCSSILISLSFLPMPVVILGILLPKLSQGETTIEKGEGDQVKPSGANNNTRPTTNLSDNRSHRTSTGRPPQLSRSTSNESTVAGYPQDPDEKKVPTPHVAAATDATSTTSLYRLVQYIRYYLTLEAWKVQHGVPKTGFGATPTSREDLVGNAVAIILPAILFTLETGTRVAQAHYAPDIGALPPWYMRKTAFWTCIFGLEAIAIILMAFMSLPKRFTNLKSIQFFPLELGPIHM